MITKLIALFRNQASSPEEVRLEDALRSEAKRIREEEEDDEVAVARIVSQAKRRPRIQTHAPGIPWLSPARGLLGGAAVLAVILLALRFGHTPKTKHPGPQLGQPEHPPTESLFADPVQALVQPFAPLAFNPLEPAAEEWNRFAGDTRERAESLIASAKSWTTLPPPTLPTAPDHFLPTLRELERFNPYGNELQRLRNDARHLIEAIPFLGKTNG